MQATKKQKLAASVIAALAVSVGVAGIATAQSGSGGEADAKYTSSVTAPDTADGKGEEDGTEDDEAKEAADLAGLATISADGAKAAALAAVPGTVVESELENENGNVVYGVEIKAADGSMHDVKVDAGNGVVLATEDEGDESGEENEADESEANEGPEGSEANEASEGPGSAESTTP